MISKSTSVMKSSDKLSKANFLSIHYLCKSWEAKITQNEHHRQNNSTLMLKT